MFEPYVADEDDFEMVQASPNVWNLPDTFQGLPVQLKTYAGTWESVIMLHDSQTARDLFTRYLIVDGSSLRYLIIEYYRIAPRSVKKKRPERWKTYAVAKLPLYRPSVNGMVYPAFETFNELKEVLPRLRTSMASWLMIDEADMPLDLPTTEEE